jgi:hypothetical protein
MLGVFAEFERDMIAARVQAGIDRQRAHLLAQRTGTEDAIGAAAIDRVIAVRSGIAQAHPPPAASAYGDALQQCAAAARRTGTAPIPPG